MNIFDIEKNISQLEDENLDLKMKLFYSNKKLQEKENLQLLEMERYNDLIEENFDDVLGLRNENHLAKKRIIELENELEQMTMNYNHYKHQYEELLHTNTHNHISKSSLLYNNDHNFNPQIINNPHDSNTIIHSHDIEMIHYLQNELKSLQYKYNDEILLLNDSIEKFESLIRENHDLKSIIQNEREQFTILQQQFEELELLYNQSLSGPMNMIRHHEYIPTDIQSLPTQNYDDEMNEMKRLLDYERNKNDQLNENIQQLHDEIYQLEVMVERENIKQLHRKVRHRTKQLSDSNNKSDHNLQSDEGNRDINQDRGYADDDTHEYDHERPQMKAVRSPEKNDLNSSSKNHMVIGYPLYSNDWIIRNVINKEVSCYHDYSLLLHDSIQYCTMVLDSHDLVTDTIIAVFDKLETWLKVMMKNHNNDSASGAALNSISYDRLAISAPLNESNSRETEITNGVKFQLDDDVEEAFQTSAWLAKSLINQTNTHRSFNAPNLRTRP
jgi:hypothetical protein